MPVFIESERHSCRQHSYPIHPIHRQLRRRSSSKLRKRLDIYATSLRVTVMLHIRLHLTAISRMSPLVCFFAPATLLQPPTDASTDLAFITISNSSPGFSSHTLYWLPSVFDISRQTTASEILYMLTVAFGFPELEDAPVSLGLQRTRIPSHYRRFWVQHALK